MIPRDAAAGPASPVMPSSTIGRDRPRADNQVIEIEGAKGYNLHITRKNHWGDEEGPEIALEEWIRCAEGDMDLQADPDNSGAENWLVSLRQGKWPIWWDATGELMTKNPEQ